MRSLDLLATLGSYTADVVRVYRHRQRFLFPALAPFSLGPETEKRIRYYTLLAPLGLGYAFAHLRGRALSPTEARTQLFLAALTPLLDDAVDHHAVDGEGIRGLLNSPPLKGGPGGDVTTAPMLALWQPIRTEVPEPERFLEAVLRTVEAQLASKRQFEPGLSQAEIRQLTFDKGGYAALLFRQALAPYPSPEEEATWYHIGGMVQFLDDLFDVYEDTRLGIHTLVNTNPDAADIQRQFEDGLRELQARCAALPYPARAVRRFTDKLLVLFVRGQVAAAQLVEVQRHHGGDFAPATYARKALITDMELRDNLWKAWGYYRGGDNVR